MTTEEKVARRKLSLLELAKDLQNVSKACKVMDYSRQQFYEIRRNYQTFGSEGLIDKLPRAAGTASQQRQRRDRNSHFRAQPGLPHPRPCSRRSRIGATRHSGQLYGRQRRMGTP